jgi:magnesium transporter
VIKAITSQGRIVGKLDTNAEVSRYQNQQASARTLVGPGINVSPTQHIERPSLSSIPEKSLTLPAVPSLKSTVSKPSARSILSEEHEQNGVTGTATVTYRERLGGYLHPRDMRRLVTPFSSSNEPELMVRRHVMLLNFDPLRAIVLRDRLLVLVPDGADSILLNLERHVRGGIDDMEKRVFGEDPTMHGSAEGFSSHDNFTSDEFDENLDQSSIEEKDETSIVEGIEVLDGYEKSEQRGASRRDERGGVASLDTNNRGNLSGNDVDEEDNYIINAEVKGYDNDDEMGKDNLEKGDRADGDEASTTTVYSGLDANNEWDELQGRKWIKLPFELQCVDSVLSSVVKMLSSDSMSLRKKIFRVMEEMRGDASNNVPGDHVQEQLRILKDNVREMESRVQGFVRAMNLILDEEEDMALMNLSRLISHPERFIQPVSQQVLNEESDEPELILEVYLQQANGEVNALNLLKGNIINTEELVSLQMDTVRNRLLYINTVVSVITLSVTCASLVGSFLGMNLTNHLETDDKAFREVVTGTIVGTISLLVVVLVAISKTGVMPANPRKVLYSKQRVDVDVR